MSDAAGTGAGEGRGDACSGCGFRYAEHPPDAVVGELLRAGRGLAALLAEHRDHERVRRAPGPGVWSPLEYGCHVRDVLLTQRDRLVRALCEDHPTFGTMHREARVALLAYAGEDPAGVAWHLSVATDLLVTGLERLTAEQWARPCLYGLARPRDRDVAWLAAHTLHEVVHHHDDVVRGLEVPAG